VFRRPWVLIHRLALVVPLVAVLVLLACSPALAQAAAGAAGWSATDCQACHDKAVGPAFAKSKHAGLDQSCGNCHENVGDHFRAQVNGDANGPVPSLKKLTANQLNTTCLKCHEKAGQANYQSSMHARRNVACTDCHGIHEYKSIRAQLKTQLDPETCASCHKAQRAKMMKTSHHPVREGKLSCASCHNPHDGAQPKMLRADSVNELCYTCHAEKRGPFLFEHAPVREDCASCHDPHGTNHKRLLLQKLPNLCWNCHLTGSGHFGSGDNLSTELGARVAPTGAPSGYPTANSRFVEKSCKNCHVNLHGSNSPSGAYFVR
jgi:DmsE family decaheme c-type cytochrome